jgi:hypothetical protein
MHFRLWTALRDSKRFYKHTNATPIHGTGQGSCPSIWLLISSILMDCLAELGDGMTMQDVTEEISTGWNTTKQYKTIAQKITTSYDIMARFIRIIQGKIGTPEMFLPHIMLEIR